MDVKRTTLHYKILTDRCFLMDGWTPSRSLCIYFWQVVARFCWCLFVMSLVVSPLATFIVMGTGTFESSSLLVRLYSSVGAMISIFYIFILFAFIVFCIVEGVKWVNSKFPREHKEPKEPSIIIEYIKAKKAKVCPMLNFTD
jgi:large-conductance mechanosensitive channel